LIGIAQKPNQFCGNPIHMTKKTIDGGETALVHERRFPMSGSLAHPMLDRAA